MALTKDHLLNTLEGLSDLSSVSRDLFLAPCVD